MTADLVPGYEGATIAAEILDASDSLWDLCAKCGWKLSDGLLLTCTGTHCASQHPDAVIPISNVKYVIREHEKISVFAATKAQLET